MFNLLVYFNSYFNLILEFVDGTRPEKRLVGIHLESEHAKRDSIDENGTHKHTDITAMRASDHTWYVTVSTFWGSGNATVRVFSRSGSSHRTAAYRLLVVHPDGRRGIPRPCAIRQEQCLSSSRG